LKSIEQTDAEWKNAVGSFTGGDAGEAGILSWTFARQKQDLSDGQISGFVKLLKHLEEGGLVTDGAGVVPVLHMYESCFVDDFCKCLMCTNRLCSGHP
jgi:hypothetical protein